MNKGRKKDSSDRKQNPMIWGAAVISGLLLVTSAVGLWWSSQEEKTGPKITVYKSASCGCCKKWVSHLESSGFNVEAINVSDLDQIKIDHGIAKEYQSCHTALINGYVVEGHVPASDIKRLITEKPSIKGLSVPGMPMGSPGMEGPRADHFEVISMINDHRSSVFSVYN